MADVERWVAEVWGSLAVGVLFGGSWHWWIWARIGNDWRRRGLVQISEGAYERAATGRKMAFWGFVLSLPAWAWAVVRWL